MDRTTQSTTQPSLGSRTGESTNAALSADPVTSTGGGNTFAQGQGGFREDRDLPQSGLQTTSTTNTGSTIGGRRDEQYTQPTSGRVAPGTATSTAATAGAATTGSIRDTAKTDTPVSRHHDQLHETVDFKPNLENPSAIPTAGGKEIGAGQIDHNATGTIGKNIVNEDGASQATGSGNVSSTVAADTQEHTGQNKALPNVSDPSTNTSQGSKVHPASAGLTTTGLDHDNVPGHSRGY